MPYPEFHLTPFSRKFQTLEWLPTSAVTNGAAELEDNPSLSAILGTRHGEYPIGMTAGQAARFYWRPQQYVISAGRMEINAASPIFVNGTIDYSVPFPGGRRGSLEIDPDPTLTAYQCHHLMRGIRGAATLSTDAGVITEGEATTPIFDCAMSFGLTPTVIAFDGLYYWNFTAGLSASIADAPIGWAASTYAPDREGVSTISAGTLTININATPIYVPLYTYSDTRLTAEMELDYVPWEFND